MLEEIGIKQIRMPLPFRLDHVHCFLAEGENSYTVIDTGLHNKQSIRVWEKELKGKQIDSIILTHLHPDHSGYAGKLQEIINAEVWMSPIDEKGLKDMLAPDAIKFIKRDYEAAAVPKEISEGIQKTVEKFHLSMTPLPKINHYLKEGQQIKIDKEIFEVIETPGHSEGLVCFYQAEKSLLLSTDHILPKITPNIAYWFYGEANPLQSFQNSLEKIKQLDVEYVVPSHGQAFKNANKRIDEIWHDHEDCLEAVLEITKNGATIFEVCEQMFHRELSVYDYQFAIGEAIAHLEYLRAKHLLQCELVNDKWIYSSQTN